VLDGRNGFALAFFLFGASVFWVPPVAPKWVPEQHSVSRLRQRVEGLSALNLGRSGAPKRAETGSGDELKR